MKRTFQSEDKRKDQIFDAWIADAPDVRSHTYFEIYEGLANVSKITGNQISLKLIDGRRVRGVSIPLKMSPHLCRSDAFFLVLGRLEAKWHLLEIISIGTIIEDEPAGFHLTVHPQLMESAH